MRMSFFLPNTLLSGFMFSFRGMPDWPQVVGDALSLTHYLRIIRGIMLKDASLADCGRTSSPWRLFALVAMAVAVARFRQILD
jgi:ABC-2 type transport system permease protein